MIRIDTPSPANTPESSTKSFKDVLLKGIEDRQNATPKSSKGPNAVKRKRVNPMGELVTSDAKFQEVLDEEKEKEAKKLEKEANKLEREAKKLEREAKKKEKEEKAAAKENLNPKAKSVKRDYPPSESESEGAESSSVDEDEDDKSRPDPKEASLFPPANDFDAYKYLAEVWDEFNPPVKETDLISKVVAFIFYDQKKKSHLFIGKIKRRFLEDENGPATSLLIESFKKAATTTSIIIEETPEHLGKDEGTYPIHDIISGSLKATILTGPTGRGSGKWTIPQYPLCVKTFEKVKNLKRKEEYDRCFLLA